MTPAKKALTSIQQLLDLGVWTHGRLQDPDTQCMCLVGMIGQVCEGTPYAQDQHLFSNSTEVLSRLFNQLPNEWQAPLASDYGRAVRLTRFNDEKGLDAVKDLVKKALEACQ